MHRVSGSHSKILITYNGRETANKILKIEKVRNAFKESVNGFKSIP